MFSHLSKSDCSCSEADNAVGTFLVVLLNNQPSETDNVPPVVPVSLSFLITLIAFGDEIGFISLFAKVDGDDETVSAVEHKDLL